MLNWKKLSTYLLVGSMAVCCMDKFGIGKSIEVVYAAETTEPKSYFLEGYGSGYAFDSSSWDIGTIVDSNYTCGYAGDDYEAGIVENNYSTEPVKEKVIRLINGLESEDMTHVATYKDARSGTAFMKETVKLGTQGQFSVKFTFSMPYACFHTGYGKEEGGDGITFALTSQSDLKGSAGGGMGYREITPSVGVEFDSFYNINSGSNYFDPNPVGWDSTKGRRDHVAVVLNGNNTAAADHRGTSFLWENGYPEGFTAAGVNDRLFTAWIEYNGTSLDVRYVQGDFVNADRNAAVVISVTDQEVIDQLNEFANTEVRVGFTSAIGSSKANHTIHSIAFVNQYLPNGIQTPYTEKYYIEKPLATDDENPIIINGKKYVLDKENVVTDKTKDALVEIADLSSVYSEYYTLVDPTVSGYPNSATIAKDGSTVVYQFFDRIPHTDEWKYTADKNVITGDCISDVGLCEQDTTGKEIVLNAGDFEYTGYPYTGGSVTDDLTAITGGMLGEIYYEGTGSTVYNKTTAPPIDVGTYKATVSIGGAVAEMEFVIHKAHEHDWTPFETVKEPTETEEGLRESHCKNNCGYKQTEIIPPLNATWEKDHSPKTGDVEDSVDLLSLIIGSGAIALLISAKMLKKD